MKKRLQGLLAGVLICAVLVCGAAYAKQIVETSELYYNNIKIFIDGGEIVPKDATGNTVEPFTVNGTTYLPVRAIAGAFGKEVEWDGATQSIYIGKKDATKPDMYLDKIQYNDLKFGSDSNKFSVVNGLISDYNGKDYTNGIVFYNNWRNSVIQDDADEASCLIAYPLNSSYKTLKGNIVLPKTFKLSTWGDEKCSSNDSASFDVWFYGDGKLLYKATAVTSSMPFALNIDVAGVNQLTVKLRSSEAYTYLALTDLALFK